MGVFLTYFAAIMLLVSICVVVNDRWIRIPPEIALLIFSLAIGVLYKLLVQTGVVTPLGSIMESLTTIRIDELLMDVLLCFMLFAGAGDLHFRKLRTHFKPIAFFALGSTIITAVVYGLLFFLLVKALGLAVDFSLCLLLGAIVSPTDPIAATGILNKLGLPEDIVTIMEGESLFNDGVGVALFIFVKGIVTNSSEAGFFSVMARELFGAIVVGLVICLLCTLLVRATRNQTYHILISLLAVSSCYAICEVLEFSGVIASVVCGIYFATKMEKYREQGRIDMATGDYESFWSSMDKILNYVLYIFIGLSFTFVVKIDLIMLTILSAIVINFVSRYIGIFIPTLALKDVRKGFTLNQFTTLMTWSGLKGGLCLAMVMEVSAILPQRAYEIMLFIVFTTILFTTIVQGLTVAKLYLHMDKKRLAKKA